VLFTSGAIHVIWSSLPLPADPKAYSCQLAVGLGNWEGVNGTHTSFVTRPGIAILGFHSWHTHWLPWFVKSFTSTIDLGIPLWIPTIMSLFLVRLILVPCLRTARRNGSGWCLRCDYDLRGSTERCPECGKPFERSPCYASWLLFSG